VPPQYTASARQVLGPDKILVIGLTSAVDEDPGRPAVSAAYRGSARLAVRPHPDLPELSAGKISAASDEVVDAIIAWGNPERIAFRSAAAGSAVDDVGLARVTTAVLLRLLAALPSGRELPDFTACPLLQPALAVC
jgi:hypothetical protein